MVLPNQLTLLRIVLTPIFFVFLLFPDVHFKQIALGVFLVAAITDWYDGWLARKFNYITNWGRIYDPLADKILTSAGFIAFVVLGKLELWMVIIVIVRDIAITGVRAYADYKDIPFPTSNYAKWKTFFQMVFLYYLLFVYVGSLTDIFYVGNENIFNFLLNENLIYFTMLIITILTFHSGVTYLWKNWQSIKKLFTNEN